jgi:aspartyl-tRNA(Asn)/glutamyl-tRNA(Gln) amidotransferase subunit A
VLAGEPPTVPAPTPVDGLRLGVPRQIVLDGVDTTVSVAFSRVLTRLSAAGVRVIDFDMPALDLIPPVNAKGGFVAPEALAWHKDLMARREAEYDPRVASRIRRGFEQSAVDMIELIAARSAIMAEAARQTRDIDALLLPTVPIVAPRFEELADDADYARINILVLRNPSLFNFLDRPAITVPCASDGLPVGAMLVGKHGHDRRLLALAQAVEPVVASSPLPNPSKSA